MRPDLIDNGSRDGPAGVIETARLRLMSIEACGAFMGISAGASR